MIVNVKNHDAAERNNDRKLLRNAQNKYAITI